MSLWRPHGLQKPNRLLRPPFSFSIVYLYLLVCLYLPGISILRQPVYQSPSACLSACSPAFLYHTVLHALDASFISSNNIRSHVRSHNDGSGRKEKEHFVPTPSTYKSYLFKSTLDVSETRICLYSRWRHVETTHAHDFQDVHQREKRVLINYNGTSFTLAWAKSANAC